MRATHWALAAGLVAVALAASARLSLRAQEHPKAGESARPVKGPDSVSPAGSKVLEGSTSVQEALEKPYALPFGEPTTLDEVCKHLRRTLKAPVVLDIAPTCESAPG